MNSPEGEFIGFSPRAFPQEQRDDQQLFLGRWFDFLRKLDVCFVQAEYCGLRKGTHPLASKELLRVAAAPSWLFQEFLAYNQTVSFSAGVTWRLPGLSCFE